MTVHISSRDTPAGCILGILRAHVQCARTEMLEELHKRFSGLDGKVVDEALKWLLLETAVLGIENERLYFTEKKFDHVSFTSDLVDSFVIGFVGAKCLKPDQLLEVSDIREAANDMCASSVSHEIYSSVARLYRLRRLLGTRPGADPEQQCVNLCPGTMLVDVSTA